MKKNKLFALTLVCTASLAHYIVVVRTGGLLTADTGHSQVWDGITHEMSVCIAHHDNFHSISVEKKKKKML